jgi:hypothetical protein
MARRIAETFGNPCPPERVTEEQFDGQQQQLAALARKPWSEIAKQDVWYYQMDLAYVTPLQQDLFDYLFPAWLLMWREGHLSRMGGPYGETDFCHAVHHGKVFERMIAPDRRAQVYEWVADAYIEGVDGWGGSLDVNYSATGPDDLHGPLWTFNALGQSMPIHSLFWDRLTTVETAGRAQWWLVFASGIAWKANECPFIPAWTKLGGGGGVYMTESGAGLYDIGYQPENLAFVRERLSHGRTPCANDSTPLPPNQNRDS